MRRSISSRRAVAVLALSLTLVAFPLGVLASHQYSDVPDSNPFHADIAAITNAGVTSGCGGGKYCPDRNVTRAEMAAFMNRLGALAAGKTPVVNADKLDGIDSSQFARKDQTQHYSCAGNDMAPTMSTTGYLGGTFAERYLTSGIDSLTCAVHLPDGATLTAFAGDVYDNTATYGTLCSLQRVTSDGVVAGLASTPSSGGAATAGYTTLVDTTISGPPIDNAIYAYQARCSLTGSAGIDLRVVKVTVTYVGAP